MSHSQAGTPNPASFQVSISSLTLGTLYEAVLAFSSKDHVDALWPSVCQNARWLIPSRRIAILIDRSGGDMEAVALFEKGKSCELPADARFTPREPLRAAFSAKATTWIERPQKHLPRDAETVEQWLLHDDPALLFVLPIRVKEKTIGLLLFPMNSLSDTDRAMLNTLGTIYALHVGMTYSLLLATKERREMQERLLMQEKMASLGSLVAGVAHEMNNPVGVIQSAADIVNLCVTRVEDVVSAGAPVHEVADDEWCRKTLGALKNNTEVIQEAGKRIATMVRSLKSFSRLDEAEYQRASVHEGIDSTLTLLEGELGDRVRVIKEYGDLPAIPCFPGELNQAFMSLLQNAAAAIEGAGTIRITTMCSGESIRIQIRDSGSGIPPEKLKRIFDFDFSRKGSRVKLGLGLSITYSIVQRHKGKIEVESQVGVGSCFTITLPAGDAAVGERS